MAALINITPGSNKERIPMKRVVLLVGQQEGEGGDLEFGKLSDNHASIIERGDGYYLRDHGSQAGSFLNEEPVVDRRLEHLDVLRFGPYQFLVDLNEQFHSEGTEGCRLKRSQPFHKASSSVLKFSIADDEPWETVEEMRSIFALEENHCQIGLRRRDWHGEPQSHETKVRGLKVMVVTPTDEMESNRDGISSLGGGVRNGDLKESPVYLEALESSLKPKFSGAGCPLIPLGVRNQRSSLEKALQDSPEGEDLSGRWGIGKPGSIEEAG